MPLMTGALVIDTAGDPVNRSRLLVFKLGGTAELPEPVEQRKVLPDYDNIEINSEQVEQDTSTYDRFCVNYHGTGAIGGGVIPNLRYSAMAASAEAWKQVVINGILSENGMISFASEVSEKEAESIRSYIVDRNRFARSIGDTDRLNR